MSNYIRKYIEITAIKYIGDYRLLISFNDGIQKIFNFEKYLQGDNGVFNPLKDKKEFKKCRIDMGGGISWNCGADLGADMLRMNEELLEK